MKIVFIAALFFSLVQFAQAMPAQIILIRHGEKPDVGDELSSQGWERAKALPDLFKRAEFKQYGDPVALYAMNKNGQQGSVRAIQTLKYLSDVFKVSINTNYTRDEVSNLIDDIKKNHKYDGKMIVVCWEHKVLINIAIGLGVKQSLSWPPDQFDRTWILDFNSAGQFKTFRDLPQKLLPSDSKN
ncbi:MAG: histidine phosphatase family protein [Bdellovibrionaceae bacterium]|nr:histidine phosphatase family protein [Pseudobdellovibrionaceae bacterium]